jgi:hypothetical protein
VWLRFQDACNNISKIIAVETADFLHHLDRVWPNCRWRENPQKFLTNPLPTLRLTPYLDQAGLGIFIYKVANNDYFEHGGANEGFRCIYMGSMKSGNGVVVMVNSDKGMILQEVVNSVSVYGWDEFKPITKKKCRALTPHQWKSLDGLYELESLKNLHLQFTSTNDKLILKQIWDGSEITFEAESEVEFF